MAFFALNLLAKQSGAASVDAVTAVIVVPVTKEGRQVKPVDQCSEQESAINAGQRVIIRTDNNKMKTSTVVAVNDDEERRAQL